MTQTRTDIMANLISPELRRRLKRTAVGAGLDAALLLKSLGAMKAAAGVGAIFTLHHVRPYSPLPFAPNRHLEVTPQFLDRAIRELKAEGRIFVALDELPQRIAAGGPPALPHSRWTMATATMSSMRCPCSSGTACR